MQLLANSFIENEESVLQFCNHIKLQPNIYLLTQLNTKYKHKQVCLTLGWSSVVFALCLLIEKKVMTYSDPMVTYSHPKMTYSFPKVT